MDAIGLITVPIKNNFNTQDVHMREKWPLIKVSIWNFDTAFCKATKELDSKYEGKFKSACYKISPSYGWREERTEQN
jgi:hypothetical protein